MKSPKREAVARSSLRLGSAVLAVILALATGPACLWLGAPSSASAPTSTPTPTAAPGVEAAASPHGHHEHHAHGDSHETASNATAAKLGHHCQCPMHRGVSASNSGAAVPVFLVRPRVETEAPPAGFSIHFAEKLMPSSPMAALEPPVPIAFA